MSVLNLALLNRCLSVMHTTMCFGNCCYMQQAPERAIQDCYFEGFYIVITSRVTKVQSFEFSLPHIDTPLLFLVETVFSILVAL